MADLAAIKLRIAEMANLALKMWKMTFQTFMDHDLDLLSAVLTEENKLNDMEKELTSALVSFGRASSSKEEKAQVAVYADVVGDLELIGDYCKDILERVQIKIEEKLLFSEDAVEEYKQLYHKTEDALQEVASALQKDNYTFLKEVLRHQEHIDSLVDQYRSHHTQRMVEGLCSPMGCNMYLNMLDFTAAIYYHTKKIARNLQKVNK